MESGHICTYLPGDLLHIIGYVSVLFDSMQGYCTSDDFKIYLALGLKLIIGPSLKMAAVSLLVLRMF